jgi:hypothetical protein
MRRSLLKPWAIGSMTLLAASCNAAPDSGKPAFKAGHYDGVTYISSNTWVGSDPVEGLRRDYPERPDANRHR